MTISIFRERSVQDVVAHYVDVHGRRGSVSTSDAVRAIRSVLPNCFLTDREMGDLVAETAVFRGYCVAFDGSLEAA